VQYIDGPEYREYISFGFPKSISNSLQILGKLVVFNSGLQEYEAQTHITVVALVVGENLQNAISGRVSEQVALKYACAMEYKGRNLTGLVIHRYTSRDSRRTTMTHGSICDHALESFSSCIWSELAESLVL
jgi:hypothetical protein